MSNHDHRNFGPNENPMAIIARLQTVLAAATPTFQQFVEMDPELREGLVGQGNARAQALRLALVAADPAQDFLNGLRTAFDNSMFEEMLSHSTFASARREVQIGLMADEEEALAQYVTARLFPQPQLEKPRNYFTYGLGQKNNHIMARWVAGEAALRGWTVHDIVEGRCSLADCGVTISNAVETLQPLVPGWVEHYTENAPNAAKVITFKDFFKKVLRNRIGFYFSKHAPGGGRMIRCFAEWPLPVPPKKKRKD